MKKILVATAATALICLACVASAVVTECVSVNSSGVPGNRVSVAGNTSADGRYVVLMSGADDLVENDTNSVSDVFVFDRQTGVTERVSVAMGDPGAQANGASCESIPDNSGFNEFAAMSADGRYVVFSSSASNLVASDTNGVPDVFVRDRINHTTTRVSVSSSGSQADGTSYFSSISADGTRVAFISVATNLTANDTNGAPDVFVRDIPTGRTYRANLSSAPSNAQATGQRVGSGRFIPDADISAWISGDGKHVAIVSGASNLVSGDTNNTYDVFVRDLDASDLGSGMTELVSVSTSGQQGNGFHWAHCNYISYSGSIVTFSSKATNMVPGDTNGVNDVFVRDRSAGTTTRVSVPPGGGQFSTRSDDPACSADGNTIGFGMDSADGTLIHAYLVNKDGTGLQRIGVDSTGSPLPGATFFPIPSSDGRFVSLLNFRSMDELSNAQAFVVDRQAVTIADAKLEANDAQVIASGGFVTMECEDGFYFQQDGIASPGRVSGIRVVWSGAVSLGKRYVVTGTTNTDPSSEERQVIATAVVPHTSGWTVAAKPLGLNNKSLGGDDWHYDSETGAGQKGIAGGSGLNNIGLLVRTTGRITAVEPRPTDTPPCFWVNDGSGLDSNQGICVTRSQPSDIQVGDYVYVMGVSTCYKDSTGKLRPAVQMLSVEPVFPARPYFIGGGGEDDGDSMIIFTPVHGAVDYRLYQSFDDVDYSLRPETSSSMSNQLRQISFSIPTNRYLRVVPVNSAGVEGTPSHTVNARVQDPRVPLTITSPTWDQAGVSRLPSITWNSIPGAEMVLVEIHTESAHEGPSIWSTVALFPATSIAYRNYRGTYQQLIPAAGPLEPNTKHWVYVGAFDSGRWQMTRGDDVPFSTGP